MIKKYNHSKTNHYKKALPQFLIKRISEGGFILAFTCALFIFLSLSTYHTSDPAWLHMSNHSSKIVNIGGKTGAYIAEVLYWLFGYFCFVLPFYGVYIAWSIAHEHRALLQAKPALLLRTSGFCLVMIGGCSLLSLTSIIDGANASQIGGGLLGNCIASGFEYALSYQGAILVLLAILLIGVTWLTGLSWIAATEAVGFYTLFITKRTILSMKIVIKISSNLLKKRIKRFKKQRQIANTIKQVPPLTPTKDTNVLISVKETKKPLPIKETNELITSSSVDNAIVDSLPKLSKPAGVKKQHQDLPLSSSTLLSRGLPSLTLLDQGQPGKPMGGYTYQDLETISREVEQHLLDFGIHADVVSVHPGPIITRFELQLAAGIKVSKLSSLSKDLARALSVNSVRVVELIPGKTVVGLELPNQHREIVRLSDVLSADVYQQAHSPLTMVLGVDIAGHPMVVDLAKMPHLLVAGTTGSGKSMGLNGMILSLLFKTAPEQVRLIMIDPKMLELSIYDDIPHLLTPVITDMKEAANALRWCVAEMEKRYKLMSALGVRNLVGFNTKITAIAENKESLVLPPFLWKLNDEPPTLNILPYIVVIIDELADMMMVVGKAVEQLIARLAQKARAAGIHLILATQRPSVDVLTGLIKSNVPTRISFQVSSKIDSRTILDQQGAEQLLGHGDMLYLAPGTGAPLRVHGTFVDDNEVHRVADDWRGRGEPDYIDGITQYNDMSEGHSSEYGQIIEEE